jgi:hypothetical protein
MRRASLRSGYDLKRVAAAFESRILHPGAAVVHGGREPELRARLPSTHWMRWPGPDGLTQASPKHRNGYRACARRTSHPDDRRPAEHRLPTDPEALMQSQARRQRQRGAFLDSLAAHVEAIGVQFDRIGVDREERLSNDPDILRSELSGMGFDEWRRRSGG